MKASPYFQINPAIGSGKASPAQLTGGVAFGTEGAQTLVLEKRRSVAHTADTESHEKSVLCIPFICRDRLAIYAPAELPPIINYELKSTLSFSLPNVNWVLTRIL